MTPGGPSVSPARCRLWLARVSWPQADPLLASRVEMEFRLLGPLEVLDEGRALEVRGVKQRALLAVLLLERNRPVSIERLVDALWDEAPTETARKALQVYVSQLRKLVGKDRLETRAPGYVLRVEQEELDLERFERLREEGRLHEALGLWRGEPLAEFAGLRFAQTEGARLEELRAACVEERIDRDLEHGRDGALVAELEALVREHPLRERLRGQLMLALFRSGRQAEALEAYQDARRALVDELGLEPGRSLRDLHQAILRQDSTLEPAGMEPEPVRAAAGSAFVGRARELSEVVAGLEAALGGSGRIILLVGEPGIGKSRLAEELAVCARSRGARVLVGRCWEAGGAPAYWPWVQSLRTYVRESEPETLRAELGTGASELAQILPEVRELLVGLPAPAPLESESARFRLFDATAEFLRNASRSRPLVLVLDDLHAADAPSLLLLQFVARQLGSSRILILGAYRDVDPVPSRALSALLTEVAREPVSRRLSLRGFTEHEVAEYLELSASELVLSDVVAALHRETEGNPLFVGETVRLLAAEGIAGDPAAPLAIPQTVRDVIARRLTHLGDECHDLLGVASVLGREFSIGTLSRLSGVSEDDLLESLDEAVGARVLSELPGAAGRLRFAHVLIRDSLYDGLTTTRRVRLHRQAVEALLSLTGPEPGNGLDELAHHSMAGREFEQALDFARRAGDRALDVLAYEQAAELYRTALEALELAGPADERLRCELLLSLGEAETRAGNSAVARKAFLHAAELARRLGLAHELARAAAGYGGRHVWARAHDDVLLIPLLEEGLAALPADAVELRARLLARLAGALRDERSPDRRDGLSREAVELARRTGNPSALAYALDGRVTAIANPETVAECLALATELCEVADRVGDRERVVFGLLDRVIALVMVGDAVGAGRDIEVMGRIADELGQPDHLWQVHAAQAMLALAAGRFHEAEQHIHTFAALGERAQPEMALPVERLLRYSLSDLRGRLPEIEPQLAGLVRTYPARPVFRCVLAHVHASVGRTAEARQAFVELATGGFATVPFDIEWLYAMSLLAETCGVLGDRDQATVLYELLEPWAAFNAVDHPEGIRGSISRYLGILAATLRRWDDAAPRFEDALAMNERMGVRPWLARTQSDYARMLLARGRPTDRDRAAELEARAAATCRELGMQG
jgi:DNA-binding SARP family transcriptional activator/tetratricopeptide (TPR) repeat protein